MVLKVTLLDQKVYTRKVAIARYPRSALQWNTCDVTGNARLPVGPVVAYCQAFSSLFAWGDRYCPVVTLICIFLNIKGGCTSSCVFNDQCASACFAHVCRKGYTLNGWSKYTAFLWK